MNQRTSFTPMVLLAVMLAACGGVGPAQPEPPDPPSEPEPETPIWPVSAVKSEDAGRSLAVRPARAR